MSVLREAAIEASCCKYARELGAITLKLHERGWPDRLFIRINGSVLFVEFKSKRGKLSPLQEYVNEKIKKRKVEVRTITSLEDFKNVFHGYY